MRDTGAPSVSDSNRYCLRNGRNPSSSQRPRLISGKLRRSECLVCSISCTPTATSGSTRMYNQNRPGRVNPRINTKRTATAEPIRNCVRISPPVPMVSDRRGSHEARKTYRLLALVVQRPRKPSSQREMSSSCRKASAIITALS